MIGGGEERGRERRGRERERERKREEGERGRPVMVVSQHLGIQCVQNKDPQVISRDIGLAGTRDTYPSNSTQLLREVEHYTDHEGPAKRRSLHKL